MSSASVSETCSTTLHSKYQDTIKNHKNYAFLPTDCTKTWVLVSKKGVNPRTEHWETKRKELLSSGDITEEATITNVARLIHPTKKHVCKKCNREVSIYYEYPTTNTWKWLEKQFHIVKEDETELKTIFDVYAELDDTTKEEKFKAYFGMEMNALEQLCKSDKYFGKKLSPGVMCNAPDRLDGFHCYNSVCGCRGVHDKGRSDTNMKQYTRDRRAYEMHSDGNCLLANCLMGELNKVSSRCFRCGKTTQMTADHIGPISLGFVHDPINFQACCSTCNSAKNNRFNQDDIDKLKALESRGATIVSWWAEHAWHANKDKDAKTLKTCLDQNAKKFLNIVEWLKINKPDVLKEFVTRYYMNHENSYKIKDIHVSASGDVVFHHEVSASKKKTKVTQYERTIEVLLETSKKSNRRLKTILSNTDIDVLSNVTVDTLVGFVSSVLVV